MEWYNYLAIFFSGAFLSNAVPHFVHGISGDRFPTPFAKPPGKGLSPAYVNVLWGAFNIIVGIILFKKSGFQYHNLTWQILFFAGVTIMALLLSITFTKKHKE